MTELSPEARALFRAARRAAAPPDGAQERVLADVELKVALGVVGATAGATWWSAAAAAKALGLAALVTAVAWGSLAEDPSPPRAVAPAPTALTRPPPAARPVAPPPAPPPAARVDPPPAAPRPRVRPTRPAALTLAPEPPPAPALVVAAPPARPALVPSPPVPPPAPAVGSAVAPLAEEVRALRAARDALQAGAARDALAGLEAYDARFPAGALRGDAAALRVRALCAEGRDGEARAYATRWVAAHPRSPLAAGVRSSCAFVAR